jgi:hypothetical protein
MSSRASKSDVAIAVPFDPTGSSLISQDVESAIKEIQQLSAASASPGFTWGLEGSGGPGKYFNNDGVESNKAGRLVPFSGFISEIFLNNEATSGMRRVAIQRRRPAQSGEFSDIVTVSLPPGQPSGTFVVNVAVLENDELAVVVDGGSSDFENCILGLIIKNNAQGQVGGSFLQTRNEGVLIEQTTTEYDFTGSGVTATSNGNGVVTVDISGGAGSGETNTASNVGSGAGVFFNKSGVDLQLRSLTSSGSGSVTEAGNEIVVNFPTIDLDVNKTSQGVDTVGGLNLNGGFTDLVFDTITNSSVATLVGADMTINLSGLYEIHYDTTNLITGGARTRTDSKLQENTGGGFSDIPGTLRSMYHRNTTTDSNSASCTIIRQFTAGDVVKVQTGRVAGPSTALTVANGAAFYVKYLRS